MTVREMWEGRGERGDSEGGERRQVRRTYILHLSFIIIFYWTSNLSGQSKNHDPVPKFYKSFYGDNYYAYAYYVATNLLV